jgi:hypothetical protein
MRFKITNLIQQKVEQLGEIEQDKPKANKETLKDLEKLEIEINAQLRTLRYLLST